MNRLTVNDLNRTCYDPWELCGMDSYCTKDCHEKGGCTKGCEILKMYKKLAEYEDLEDQCIKETTWSLRMFLKKWNEFFEDIQELYEYRKLEEQGLLLKLPCKVGDIIYFPDESINYVFPIMIAQIIISDLGEGKYCVQYNGCFFNGYGDTERDFEFETDDFGKTVFLTQTEADAALKKMKSGEE